jgi:hypothetical protein
VGACRKHLEEQERADLLSRRSGAPDWQSEVGSCVRWCSCMEADMNRGAAQAPGTACPEVRGCGGRTTVALDDPCCTADGSRGSSARQRWDKPTGA